MSRQTAQSYTHFIGALSSKPNRANEDMCAAILAELTSGNAVAVTPFTSDQFGLTGGALALNRLKRAQFNHRLVRILARIAHHKARVVLYPAVFRPRWRRRKVLWRQIRLLWGVATHADHLELRLGPQRAGVFLHILIQLFPGRIRFDRRPFAKGAGHMPEYAWFGDTPRAQFQGDMSRLPADSRRALLSLPPAPRGGVEALPIRPHPNAALRMALPRALRPPDLPAPSGARAYLQALFAACKNLNTADQARFCAFALRPVLPISGQSGRNIARWFSQSLAPHMGLSPPSIHIAGAAPNQTGLGRNMAMMRLATKGLVPPQPLTVHMCNADRIPQQILRPGAFGGRQIGFLLWELDQIPAAHRAGLTLLDELWVPTRFVAQSYAPHFSGPIHIVGKGLSLPELPPRSTRVRPFTFLLCFDSHSSVVRKNPLAAARAFQAAFAPRQDVRLIIKMTPMPKRHWGDPEAQVDALRKLAASDKRILLREEFLPFPAFLRLIAEADCLVAPHRAEGFGYLPAYALWYGVPVITTDYSGPADFCTPDTARIVPHRLTPVPMGHSLYPCPGAQWAQIDPDGLIAAMRDTVNAPATMRTLAKQGQTLMRRHYAMDTFRDTLQSVLSEPALARRA